MNELKRICIRRTREVGRHKMLWFHNQLFFFNLLPVNFSYVVMIIITFFFCVGLKFWVKWLQINLLLYCLGQDALHGDNAMDLKYLADYCWHFNIVIQNAFRPRLYSFIGIILDIKHLYLKCFIYFEYLCKKKGLKKIRKDEYIDMTEQTKWWI